MITSSYKTETEFYNIQNTMPAEAFDEFDRFCDIVTTLTKNTNGNLTHYTKVVRQTKRHIVSRFGKIANKATIDNMLSLASKILGTDIVDVDINDLVSDMVPEYSKGLVNIVTKESEITTVKAKPVDDKPEEPVTNNSQSSYLYTNVIMCKGGAILVHKIADTYYLPGGFARFNESGRTAGMRYLKEQCNIYVNDASRFDLYSSYESEEKEHGDRYMVVNFMYNSKEKHFPSTTSSNDFAGFVDFDKTLEMKVYPSDREIIRRFILK